MKRVFSCHVLWCILDHLGLISLNSQSSPVTRDPVGLFWENPWMSNHWGKLEMYWLLMVSEAHPFKPENPQKWMSKRKRLHGMFTYELLFAQLSLQISKNHQHCENLKPVISKILPCAGPCLLRKHFGSGGPKSDFWKGKRKTPANYIIYIYTVIAK